VEEAARATEALTSVAGASASVTVAPPEPSRKRKQGFSSLR
jgi:hypothetical protein